MISTEIGGGKMGTKSQCYGNTSAGSSTSSNSNVISSNPRVMYASTAAVQCCSDLIILDTCSPLN